MQKYPENILKEIPIFSYDSTLLLESLSNYLTTSNYIKPIKDQDILKLGVAKEMPPSNENWIYVRAASIFRTLCLQTMQNKDTSLRFFSKKYNSRQNRGCRPSRFARGGVAHLKHIIECFKDNKLVEENDGKYKMTKEGLDMMKNFLEKMME